MKLNSLKILDKGENLASTEVYINGQKVNYIRKIEFVKEADEFPLVKLELLIDEIDIDLNNSKLDTKYIGVIDKTYVIKSGLFHNEMTDEEK